MRLGNDADYSENINKNIIDNLLDIYAESMEAMESSFDNHNEMIDEYISFIKDFINKPQQLIMIEEVENIMFIYE